MKVSEEGGGEGAPGARADIPLPLHQIMVMHAVLLQLMEEHSGADTHPVACGGAHT